jgi:hypothetical protein
MGIIPEDIIRAARVEVRQGRTADCNVIEGLHQRPEGRHLLDADTAEAFLQGEADSLGQTLPGSLRQFTGYGMDRGVFDIERHTGYSSMVDNYWHGTMPCGLGIGQK